MDIQTRCQPQIDVKCFHLKRNRFSKSLHQISVPGLSHYSSYRECSAVLIILVSALMLFSVCQEAILKCTQYTNSVNGICCSVHFIVLLQSDTCRSVCHDQRLDSVLIKQCFTRLSCCSRHFNSRCSKCTSDFRHISIHKWNQIFYRNLRFFWKSAYFLFFCLWFK